MADNTLDDFIADFKLMFSNAKIFNDDASIVYKDTITMERAFDDKVAELTGRTINTQSAPQNTYDYAQHQQMYSSQAYGAQPYVNQAYPAQNYQQPSRVNAIINSDDEDDD